jgi:hypothetical protein
MQTPLMLLILTTTTPFTIYLLGSIIYYWDYVGYVFSTDASNEVFDFIVGKWSPKFGFEASASTKY